MIAVIQRVAEAGVTIKNDSGSPRKTGRGLVVLLGVEEKDTAEDVVYLAGKVANLRIFPEEGKMKLSAIDINAEILVISQFTLLGDCIKGRRPDFTAAAAPDMAKSLYKQFIDKLKAMNLKTAEGEFGADMLVSIRNEGPVTIIIDTKKLLKKNNQ